VSGRRYAERTRVSSEASRGEIERTLSRYGAAAFGYGWTERGALVSFIAHSRRVQFTIALPDPSDYRLTPSGRQRRSDLEAERAWEQATRQRWRALALMVKSKLEAVASGIATFEEEFLPYTIVPGPDGTPITVAELLEPQIAEAYENGSVPGGIMLALEAGES
jgi:hypothetical protein